LGGDIDEAYFVMVWWQGRDPFKKRGTWMEAGVAEDLSC
jgi:hypothetical protein